MKLKPNTLALLLIILVTLVYFLPGLLSPRDFWVEDEARYGEILREMVHFNQWVVPHLNDHFYPDKPPVFFWLAALVSIITGKITPFSGLLITWFTTLGAVLVTWSFAKTLWNERAAFLTAMIFVSTFLVIGMAQIVRMDMMLTWFSMWAVYCFYLWYTKEQKKYIYLFYVFAAMAVLGKGPFGFTFPWFTAIIFLILEKEWKKLFKFVVHPGLILSVLIALSWMILAWFTGNKDFVLTIINEQLLGRAVNSFSHKEPLWFYLAVLPFVTLPWFPFVPRALKRWGTGFKLLLIYFISGFVTISVVSGKLFIYLLPLVPPIAMIVGKLIDELLTDKGPAKAWRIESVIAVLLTFGIFIAIAFAAPHFPITDLLNVAPLAWIFIPLTMVGLYFAWTRRVKSTFVVLVLGMYLFSAYMFQAVMVQINPYFSGRAIGNEISQFVREGNKISQFRVRRGILNFYAETIIPELGIDDVKGYFSGPDKLLILKESEYNKQGELLNRTQVLSHYEIANEKYVIIGNKNVR